MIKPPLDWCVGGCPQPAPPGLYGQTMIRLALVLAFAALPAFSGDLVGRVIHIRDGDTLEVAGIPVRLDGLHAPERIEAYGREASAMMARIVAGQTLSCALTVARSYDREIGLCRDEAGHDVARALVEAGLGRDCPRYSRVGTPTPRPLGRGGPSACRTTACRGRTPTAQEALGHAAPRLRVRRPGFAKTAAGSVGLELGMCRELCI